MKNLFTVTKNELLRYFISPLAYVYLIAFLVLNASFAIYFGGFFERGQANLATMFYYQPWLYLIFIPGISMRLWAEEFRNKTIIQIMTMPISITSLVLGKFFASWIFCGLALLLTFPFWITVNILGDPDNAVIVLSYVGSFILAGCMLAISQTMSALTKNQVIALVLAVIANMLFFLSGIEYVLSFFRLFAPLPIIDMIASFSFITHFNIITAGLLEFRDIIFFASIILLFNFTTVIIVSFKTSGTSQFLKSTSKTYYIFTFLLLLIGFIGLNLLANNALRGFQHDFTSEKKFTLSQTGKELLENLKEPVTAKLYYSRILEERNPNIRLMFDNIRSYLREFSKISKGRFNYIIYNPEPLDNIEDQAYAAGLQPIPVIDINQNAFFGMVISDEVDNKQTIPFFNLDRINSLEQDLIEKIYTLNREKKNIGIISSLPIYDTAFNESYVTPKWEIISQIENLYNLKIIKKAEDFHDIDVLMLIHPQQLGDELTQRIIDYTDNGGKSLVLLDIAAEAPRIFSPVNQEMTPSNIGKLEKVWGFKFHKELVVADLENSITVDASTDYQNNPMFTQDIIQFIIPQSGFNKEAVETKNLNKILFSSASVIEPISPEVNFTPLIEASKVSEIFSSDVVYKNIHPSYLLSQFSADTQQKVIAAKIIGPSSNNPFEVIVVADSDFAYDSFWTETKGVLDNNYLIPIFDNGNFILNSLESLSGGDNLIELRGKTQISRPFKNIEKIRKESRQSFKVEENKIFRKIEDAKDKIQEIWNKKKFENRENFTADELAIIASIRKNLDTLRTELSNIQKNQDKEIKQINFKIKFYNIYSVPLAIVAVLLLLSLVKTKRAKRTSSKIDVNRKIIILGLSSVGLLILGIVSVYIANYNDLETYIGQPVFEDLEQKINDVEEISLTTNTQQLNFYKKDNIWYSKEMPNIPVYQERIRSFLSAMIEPTYFEKKTDKAEYLSKFGLNPIEQEKSPNTLVTLKNKEGKNILAFEVGKQDIDIGRGAKAAYIKFEDKFQVWLISVDFIDLSAKWQDWSYSTIWNLRFGRLVSFNNNTKTDLNIAMIKLLLNTSFENIGPVLPNAKLLFSVDLNLEGNNKVSLSFFEEDNRFYVQYNFSTTHNNEKLQFFASYVKDSFLEINAKNLKAIEYVTNNK